MESPTGTAGHTVFLQIAQMLRLPCQARAHQTTTTKIVLMALGGVWRLHQPMVAVLRRMVQMAMQTIVRNLAILVRVSMATS